MAYHIFLALNSQIYFQVIMQTLRSFLPVFLILILPVFASAITVCTSSGDDLQIAKGGKITATIIVSPEAGQEVENLDKRKRKKKTIQREWERRAAEDLAKYLELMSGAKPAIADTQEAISQALKKKDPLFIIGEAALFAKPALKQELSKVGKKEYHLRNDAIIVQRDGNRVYLAGTNEDSHYFAVSWLLREMGCRFFIPTELGDCIPEHDEIKIGKLSHSYAPPFEVRSYWISWVGDQTGAKEFRHRNMMNSRVNVPSGHALGKYVKELIPKGKNAFNVPISDPKTADHIAAQLEERFGANEMIMLGMDDGTYQSDYEGDETLRANLYDKYFDKPFLTDPFLTLYNGVADKLLKKHPKSTSKIGFLAYSNITLPPQRDIVASKPLYAELAPIDIDPIHHMDHPDSPPRNEYKQMLYRWAKVMEGRVTIYDYDQGMLVWRDIPNPAHQSFAVDIKHYRDAGVLGVNTESRNAIATTFLNLYLRGQLYWNPDADVDAMLQEFYPAFYGPAAQPMENYWNAIYKAWEETIVTEHEHFVVPAVYTPELVDYLGKQVSAAEKAIQSLSRKSNPSRNESLYLQRMKIARLQFEVLDAYTKMVEAANTDVDYAAAVKHGERGLKARDEMTELNGTFTTYKKYGERGPAWWPGEVQQYRKLAEFTGGTKGKLIKKLPLEWAFHRDPNDTGLASGWGYRDVDLSFWEENKSNYDANSLKDYPADQWEMLRTDLYIQAQGVRHPDRQSFTGYGWYNTKVNLSAGETKGKVHLKFPGLFNECWLYVNGSLVAHRKQRGVWWYNDYRFEWDVDLAGLLKSGENNLTLRFHNPHHFGGMFRRPFLYQAVGE